MANESEHGNRAGIVDVARGMLNGRVGIIDGARKLNDLRVALGIYHLDDDFVGFVAIDSETDTLPIGETTI